MQITLKVQQFSPDHDTSATVLAYNGNMQELKVQIVFSEEDGWNQHQIVIDDGQPVKLLPHYAQAKIILRACEMIDSFFTEDNPDVGPSVRDDIEI